MGGFSQSRSFLGGAINTVTSPLRDNFKCQSPCTPRRPSRPTTRDDNNRPSPNHLFINTENARYGGTAGAYSSSTYLATPRTFSIISPSKKEAAYSSKNQTDDDTSSSTTLVSSSGHAFPLTPQYQSVAQIGKLGTFSAINIILGKTVGVGIYSIPSSIFNSVGSVGASILVWVVGSLISFCGLAVYLDLGTGIPRSGGERIYLERIFKRPHMLATCMFMAYVVLLGFSTPNCIVLGEYVMYALQIEVNRWNVRVVAVAVITLLCVIHGRYQKLGLRIINVLGVGKMLILVVVILSGIAGALMHVGAASSPLTRRRLGAASYSEFELMAPASELSTAQRNFSNLFSNSSTQPYDYATALLKVLYSFRGYSSANQVLSEVRNPVPTLRRAAPIALALVSIGYILANIAYFLVVDAEDFRTAGVVIAGHFFRNIFGPAIGEHVLPLFIIVSAFGNIAATSFAQARVNQELGKDGLLPFSHFFSGGASKGNTTTTTTPTAGLFLHWLISVLVIVVPPPGDIYNFLVDIGGYPVSVISVAISLGLLYVQSTPAERWSSPFRAKRVYIIIFAASNCLLLVLPWVKPQQRRVAGGEGRFPYYAYPATALGILTSGVVYWVWWAGVKPVLARDWRAGMAGGGLKEGVGEEGMPMMLFGSEDGDAEEEEENEHVVLREEGSRLGGDQRNVLVRKDSTGIRQRAPCGCPIDHGAARK